MTTTDTGSPLPSDLVALRTASDECGVSVHTLRGWIYQGKGGRKLPTFRAQGDPHTVRVSRASVHAFKDSRTGKTRATNLGRMTISLDRDSAADCRELTRLVSQRIGVHLSCTEAMRSVIQNALRLEVLRAEQAGEVSA